jgi:hypothetical protein
VVVVKAVAETKERTGEDGELELRRHGLIKGTSASGWMQGWEFGGSGLD